MPLFIRTQFTTSQFCQRGFSYRCRTVIHHSSRWITVYAARHCLINRWPTSICRCPIYRSSRGHELRRRKRAFYTYNRLSSSFRTKCTCYHLPDQTKYYFSPPHVTATWGWSICAGLGGSCSPCFILSNLHIDSTMQGQDAIWRLVQHGSNPGSFVIQGSILQPAGSGPRHIAIFGKFPPLLPGSEQRSLMSRG